MAFKQRSQNQKRKLSQIQARNTPSKIESSVLTEDRVNSLSFFVTRTRGAFWTIKPAPVLLGAVLITQAIAMNA